MTDQHQTTLPVHSRCPRAVLAGTPAMDKTTAAFEAWPHRDQYRPWLHGSWGWRVLRDDGLLLADGEGCSCVEVALETASIVAREEFQING